MLENFFQNQEIKDGISHAEHFRKIRYAVLIPSILIVMGICIYLGSTGSFQVEIGDTGSYRPSNAWDGFMWWIIWSFIVFWIIASLFKSRIEWALKKTILAKLAKELYSKLEYDDGGKYAFGDLNILKMSWLIHSYDQIDTVEDSMWFTIEEWNKYIVIQWYELQTSEMRSSGKRRKRVTTNHCYLMKIRFPNNRIELQDDLLIKSDEADSPSRSIVFWIIWLLIWSLIGGFLSGILQSPAIIPIIAIIWAVLGYILRRNYINKHRVILENVEFEKYFDVVCNDQIGSRMIITPAFMDRLVKLANKRQYKYELLCKSNCFYIKWNVWNTYLEVNTWKNIETNIWTFIDWYSQMRDIISFVFEMRMTYFSKTLYEAIDPNELKFETMWSVLWKDSFNKSWISLWWFWASGIVDIFRIVFSLFLRK